MTDVSTSKISCSCMSVVCSVRMYVLCVSVCMYRYVRCVSIMYVCMNVVSVRTYVVMYGDVWRCMEMYACTYVGYVCMCVCPYTW